MTKKVTSKTKKPIKKEWEYTAKGGQRYEYADGNNIKEVAWYKENSGDKPHPVKQKEPNGYGLYDITGGNVWEWTSDTRRLAWCAARR